MCVCVCVCVCVWRESYKPVNLGHRQDKYIMSLVNGHRLELLYLCELFLIFLQEIISLFCDSIQAGSDIVTIYKNFSGSLDAVSIL
jgi:hypothetical protein